jgi:hypothetical protein
MAPPKANFRVPLPDGSNLSVSVFPTKKDPKAEVIAIQIGRKLEEEWENRQIMAIYRSPEGDYVKLPDREEQQ